MKSIMKGIGLVFIGFTVLVCIGLIPTFICWLFSINDPHNLKVITGTVLATLVFVGITVGPMLFD
jgi:hypothetical protein